MTAVGEMVAYENLANAIIEQAVSDYRGDLNSLKNRLKKMDKLVYNYLKTIEKHGFVLSKEETEKVDELINSFKEFINPIIDNIAKVQSEFDTIRNKYLIEILNIINNSICESERVKILAKSRKKEDKKVESKVKSINIIINDIFKYSYDAKSIEIFFTSDLYRSYTSVDGLYIVNKITEEINNS